MLKGTLLTAVWEHAVNAGTDRTLCAADRYVIGAHSTVAAAASQSEVPALSRDMQAIKVLLCSVLGAF